MKPLKEVFSEMEKVMPELGGGIAKRREMAEKFAALDAPVLKKDVAELRKLYEELFFNIATDELLEKCGDGITAQQRWNLVEPFTW